MFVPENGPHAAEALRIDYESIRHLDFGQRASRRVPLVVAATAVLGPFGLMSLSAYHDHSWRGTGRNLYMGLAGFYLLKEDSEIDGQLPHGPYDVPLMLQARSFTAEAVVSGRRFVCK